MRHRNVAADESVVVLHSMGAAALRPSRRQSPPFRWRAEAPAMRIRVKEFPPLFRDRREAGMLLARRLAALANTPDLLVLALPRGGVPIAYEVARALHAPLDIVLVRKLGVPGHAELAMGAIAEGGVRVLNHAVIRELGIPSDIIEHITTEEQRILEQRRRLYRGDRRPPTVEGARVILIDDGLATGMTMQAAIEAVRRGGPAGIIVATPVAAPESVAEIEPLVDEVVALATPELLYAIGMWYSDFTPTSDEEVRALLAEAFCGYAPAPRSDEALERGAT
jgi:putative phosphoribosyl transferase